MVHLLLRDVFVAIYSEADSAHPDRCGFTDCALLGVGPVRGHPERGRPDHAIAPHHTGELQQQRGTSGRHETTDTTGQ